MKNEEVKKVNSMDRQARVVAKKLTDYQIRVLTVLKDGAYIRVWHQEVGVWGWHSELRSRNNRLLKPRVNTYGVELLESGKKQGKLIKLKSKSENERIYVISKRGLEVLERELKKGEIR